MESLLLRQGKSDISPKRAVTLAGFSMRKNPYTDIHDVLEANLIILQSGQRKIAFLSLDLLFVGKDIYDCAQESARQIGVEPDHLIVCASHTHFAPTTDGGKPNLGTVNTDYIEELRQKIKLLFMQTDQKSGIDVSIEHTRVDLNHAVHRRRKGWHIDPETLRLKNGVYMAPNTEKTTDDTATLIRFKDAHENTQAIIWNYACHPTGFPAPLSVSADFPGMARETIRKKCKTSDLCVVFLQGFAGDKRAIEVGGNVGLKGRLRRLVGGPHFGKFNNKSYNDWARSLAEKICAPLEQQVWQTSKINVQAYKTAISLKTVLTTNEPNNAQVSLQKIQLSSSLVIVAISAEVVTAYGKKIAEALNIKRESLLPVGYIDDVFGYLPTESMSKEGGYESSGFLPAFNLSGARFNSGFELAILETIKTLDSSTVSAIPQKATS